MFTIFKINLKVQKIILVSNYFYHIQTTFHFSYKFWIYETGCPISVVTMQYVNLKTTVYATIIVSD